MLQLLGPKYGIDPEGSPDVHSLPNFAELNSMAYMHTVVPNLRNLGLITERTESDWRRVGMMVDSARTSRTWSSRSRPAESLLAAAPVQIDGRGRRVACSAMLRSGLAADRSEEWRHRQPG